MFTFRSVFTPIILGLAAVTSFAQTVPATINYQGRLTDNTPSPAPINATVNMTFEIWDAASAGTRLWLEPNSGATPIAVTTGIFNVLLGASAGGSSVPLPASLFNGGTTRYLQIIVNGETLTPRQRISATGYANQAQNAALAANATNATTAATATNATQLGGVSSASWQRSLATTTCPAGQFYSAIAQGGSANCATVQSTITPPFVLSGAPGPIVWVTNTGVGDGIFSVNSSTNGFASGLYGRISSATPGALSTGVRGENQGTGVDGFGVWGTHSGGGWGVYGSANGGHGVHGDASSGGIGGYFSNAGGTALYANGNTSMTGNLNFGSTTRQMLNLWGTPDVNNSTPYGIGVQGYTLYSRTDTGGGFAWYSGGTHSNTQNDPGAGGTKLMNLDGGGNIAQPQSAAGAVKAMALILPNGTIARCYNGGLPGGPTTTVPCGMTASHLAAGDYSIDFGFRTDNRFVNLSTSSANRSLNYFMMGAPPSNVVEFVTVVSGVSSPVDTDFMAFIY